MLDNQSIEIPCENCGAKTSKTIGWIKKNREYTCSCGTSINLQTKEFLDDIRKIENQLKNMFK